MRIVYNESLDNGSPPTLQGLSVLAILLSETIPSQRYIRLIDLLYENKMAADEILAI
jgi:hypothetical protein